MSTWPSFRIPLDVVLVFPYIIKLSVVVAGVECAYERGCLFTTYIYCFLRCVCVSSSFVTHLSGLVRARASRVRPTGRFLLPRARCVRMNYCGRIIVRCVLLDFLFGYLLHALSKPWSICLAYSLRSTVIAQFA